MHVMYSVQSCICNLHECTCILYVAVVITYWEVVAEGALGFKGRDRTFIALIKLFGSSGGLKLENVRSLVCRKNKKFRYDEHLAPLISRTCYTFMWPTLYFNSTGDVLKITWDGKWFLDMTLWENGRRGLSMTLSDDTTTSARNWGLSER